MSHYVAIDPLTYNDAWIMAKLSGSGCWGAIFSCWVPAVPEPSGLIPGILQPFRVPRLGGKSRPCRDGGGGDLLRRPLVLPARLIVLHRGVSGGAKDFRRWPMEDVAVPALRQR
jgi:hypothetical protein